MNLPTDTCKVKGLFIYPVKALRGVALARSRIGARGLDGDREWMIVREDGRFVSQRDLPRLALLAPRYEDDSLCIEAPGRDPLRVPLAYRDAEAFAAQVWSDACEVLDAGPEASRWLQAVVQPQRPLRLVRMRRGFRRRLARAPLLGEATTTAFADAAPFLVVNIASLQALNAGLAQRGQPAVGIERFRPNIVVDGLDAFREHALSGLQRDEGSFRLCYPCERCAVITVDPALGVRDEPGRAAFATLAAMNPLPGTAKPLFGINATWQGEDTSLGVGDVFVARESTQEAREEIP